MSKKGGLESVKLYYEDLPSVSQFKKPKNKKSQSKSKKDILDNNMVLGFALLVPVIFQKRLVNRHTVLSNLDDREIMPKVPPTNKKRATKSKRQKVV